RKPYDSIPSNADIKMPSIEDTIDVKVLQENLTAKKHHDWDDQRTIFKIQLSNHRIGQDDEIKAQYRERNSVSASWTEPVKVYLKDPWYVSDPELLTQPETYREINSGENQSVFLEEGGGFFEYPYYSVQASKFYATDNAIYEFSHWSSPNGKATFDPNNVDNYAGCGVRFDQDGAVVKPNYVAVNQIADYNLTIPSDETLSIPAGASIQVADGFTFEVDGTLEIEGTIEQSITLYSNGRAPTFIDPYTSVPAITDYLIVSKGNSTISMSNVNIKDTYCGLSLDGTNAMIELDDVEIENCNVGVFIDSPNNILAELNRINIHDCHVGILFNESLPDQSQTSGILIHHSVLSDINYQGIFLYFGYPFQTISSTDSRLNLIVDFCTFANIGLGSSNGNGIYTYNDNNNYGKVNLDIYESIFHTAPITLPIYRTNWTINSGYNFYYNSGVKPTGFYASINNPLLVNSSSHGNYHLQYASPAIDAGYAELQSDLFPNYSYIFDPDEPDPDIGAYYCPQMSVSGSIGNDTTWYGIVSVTSDVNVSNGVELIVNPGTLIKFNAGKELRVYGVLDVNGISTSPIVFTRSDPGSTSRTYWDGIRMYSGSSFDLDYVNIYGASRGVYSYYSTGSIDYSLFEENSYGFYGNYSDYVGIRHSTFNENNYGCKMNNSDPINLIDNTFSNNQYYGAGYVRSYGTVNQNTFSGNSTYGMYVTSIASVTNAPQTYSVGDEENWSINNRFSNNGVYNVYIGSSGYADLGTYELISPIVYEVAGGFNYFIRGSASYDIYNASSNTIPAEVN
ncbi:MAG: right-handed parallel beta-helix repeat-containing protein, partial [Fidelibacterota bacterium]